MTTKRYQQLVWRRSRLVDPPGLALALANLQGDIYKAEWMDLTGLLPFNICISSDFFNTTSSTYRPSPTATPLYSPAYMRGKWYYNLLTKDCS